ncbi:MAG: pyridoxal phosphate-dependent aminotransferase [Elusimicrobiota bacterium]|nr:pyridoxal phosphate-dependent aminotransferase [Endomicrobiia bacterium]MDW8166239.1 pyridoxal phosphate-dependent aminotransferase [Elusimicrobiota bacterium]
MKLSSKIQEISPSATLSITAKAKQLKSQGIKVIAFAAGEPDFDTPEFIKQKAKEALDKGLTKYTPTAGIPELKQAICEKLKKENNLEYTPEEVLVSCGAKHSIFNAIMALVDDGDEVLLPKPYWVSYPEMIKFARGKIIEIPTNERTNFKIKADQLKEYITPKTKLLILNYPSNPTGMMYTKQELQEIANVLVENQIYCISDEIYEKLVYDGLEFVSIASLNSEIKKLTITVNGLSKCCSMTGWRVGYACGPKEIIQAMGNLQDHSTSNITTFVQYASVDAIKYAEESIKKMVEEFKKRRDYIVEEINKIPELSVIKPQGAFYVWVNISKLKGKKYNNQIITDSMKLSELLLTEARVSVIPGCVFGDDDYIRLSYAISLQDIKEGLDNIKKFIETIR